MLPSAQEQGAQPQGNWALWPNHVAYMLGLRLASMANWSLRASQMSLRVGGLRVRLGRRWLGLRLMGCEAGGEAESAAEREGLEGEGSAGRGRLDGEAGVPNS